MAGNVKGECFMLSKQIVLEVKQAITTEESVSRKKELLAIISDYYEKKIRLPLEKGSYSEEFKKVLRKIADELFLLRASLVRSM